MPESTKRDHNKLRLHKQMMQLEEKNKIKHSVLGAFPCSGHLLQLHSIVFPLWRPLKKKPDLFFIFREEKDRISADHEETQNEFDKRLAGVYIFSAHQSSWLYKCITRLDPKSKLNGPMWSKHCLFSGVHVNLKDKNFVSLGSWRNHPCFVLVHRLCSMLQ